MRQKGVEISAQLDGFSQPHVVGKDRSLGLVSRLRIFASSGDREEIGARVLPHELDSFDLMSLQDRSERLSDSNRYLAAVVLLTAWQRKIRFLKGECWRLVLGWHITVAINRCQGSKGRRCRKEIAVCAGAWSRSNGLWGDAAFGWFTPLSSGLGGPLGFSSAHIGRQPLTDRLNGVPSRIEIPTDSGECISIPWPTCALPLPFPSLFGALALGLLLLLDCRQRKQINTNSAGRPACSIFAPCIPFLCGIGIFLCTHLLEFVDINFKPGKLLVIPPKSSAPHVLDISLGKVRLGPAAGSILGSVASANVLQLRERPLESVDVFNLIDIGLGEILNIEVCNIFVHLVATRPTEFSLTESFLFIALVKCGLRLFDVVGNIIDIVIFAVALNVGLAIFVERNKVNSSYFKGILQCRDGLRQSRMMILPLTNPAVHFCIDLLLDIRLSQ
mmetsp:Transcript_2645/g.7761  ORF Transcript_2645/g.7761 Transcript_2645/m.7761 type:complete len:445 (+) Transcript_2645:2420-3754(+)